jgi:hypothetical protein
LNFILEPIEHSQKDSEKALHKYISNMSWNPTCNGDVPTTNTPPLSPGVLGVQGRRRARRARRTTRLRSSDVLVILTAALAVSNDSIDDDAAMAICDDDSAEEDAPTVQ